MRAKIFWPLLSALSAALAGVATRKLVNGLWKAATGDEVPPADDDATATWGEALAWAAGIGAAAGVARVLSRRASAVVWEKATGDPPPGEVEKL